MAEDNAGWGSKNPKEVVHAKNKKDIDQGETQIYQY